MNSRDEAIDAATVPHVTRTYGDRKLQRSAHSTTPATGRAEGTSGYRVQPYIPGEFNNILCSVEHNRPEFFE